MELTLDQALQKGVEAHKAGKAQEADQYYTAILKANPKHPDANHNMGVLAVGVGKVETALPFFKTALEINPNIAQFWLSYIDALIKLDCIADAKAVFDQAKSNGAKGDDFYKLEKRLKNVAKIQSNQTNEEMLKKAVDLRENGKYDEAIDLLLHHKMQSPTDPNLIALLSHCYLLNDNLEQAKVYLEAAKEINPNIASVGWNETRLLLKQKKVNEALAVSGKTNRLFPDDVEGMGVLGSCLRANGEYDEGLKALNRAISINPNYAEALISRGLIYLEKQDKTNALKDLQKAHELKPHIKQIWELLISLIVETKNYSKAIYFLINMIEVDPGYEKIYPLLAVCNQEADDPALAKISFEKILEVRPNDPVNILNLGRALQREGKNEEAVKCFKKVLKIKPDYVEAYNNLGNALKERGKLEEAIKAYNKALSIKPDYATAYNNMGNALKEEGKVEEAIEAYSKALSIKPDYAVAYNNMGTALQDQGKTDEAIIAYKEAILINSDYADAYNNIGTSFQELGKLNKAKEAYYKALSLKPDFTETHRNLSAICKYSNKNLQFIQVKKLLDVNGINDENRCNLNFAIAKMYEDIGDLKKAFYHLTEGNALRKKLLDYSIDQDVKLFSRLRTEQSLLQKYSLIKRKKILTEPIPIFIVGMPRSGTTLVEQIISSHSKVTGAGELNYVAKYGAPIALGTIEPHKEAILEFREKYLSELTKLSQQQSFIIDKMPHNFLYVPLICVAFPEAKIVHIKRNTAATCWSNYKQYFTNKGLDFCYDLNDVVKYYELYRNLMEFWQSQYGDRIYNLNYENLTTDQENQTRKLIKHIGLSWEEACLSPHKNKRSVKTASQQQVRQKVYKGSSEAWRKYEPYLNGAFDNLPS